MSVVIAPDLRDESAVRRELREAREALRKALENVSAQAQCVHLRAINAVGDIRNCRQSYHGAVQLQEVIEAGDKIPEYEARVQQLLAELGGMR